MIGYLKFQEEPDGRGIRGALFLTTVRGDPLEFEYARVDTPRSFLWRAGDSRRSALGSLIRALFVASTRRPDLILALADEVPALIFSEDVKPLLPTARFSSDLIAQVPTESQESLGLSGQIAWVGEPPASDSRARSIAAGAAAVGGLEEPFQRAGVGLHEAFGA